MKMRRRINIRFPYNLWRQFRSQVDDEKWLSMDRMLVSNQYGNAFESEVLIYAAIRLLSDET